MDRQHVQRCMEQVAAYRASGQKAKVWAEANGVPLGTLGSWCAHYRRWQARLDGGAGAEPASTRPSGFVAARVATPASTSSVRIELNAGAAAVELHWPLAHARELAVLLRELGR
ncbi:MAG: hypothetical protein U1E95_03340 [Rubrivivax sp.]|nr:hypothetical protein [Rubrivivax sp.]HRY87562.1 hypothetical protein [Rubrivivax sp.]